MSSTVSGTSTQVFFLSCFFTIFLFHGFSLIHTENSFYHLRGKTMLFLWHFISLRLSTFSFSTNIPERIIVSCSLQFFTFHPASNHWPQKTLETTFIKGKNGLLSLNPIENFYSSLYQPCCNIWHRWLLTSISKLFYFLASKTGLFPCFYSHL